MREQGSYTQQSLSEGDFSVLLPSCVRADQPSKDSQKAPGKDIQIQAVESQLKNS